jgi:hypothetical protein
MTNNWQNNYFPGVEFFDQHRMAQQAPGPPPPDHPNAGFLEQQKAFTENLQVLTQQAPGAPVPGKLATYYYISWTRSFRNHIKLTV